VRSASKQKCSSATASSMDAFLHELRPRPAEEVFRPLSSRARTPVGANSRNAACRCATPASDSSSGTRTVAARAHPVDQVLPASGRHDDVGRGAESGKLGHLCRLGEGVTFLTEPLEREVELTGPVAAKLWVSSATEDVDLFLVVRAFTPDSRRSRSGRARFAYADRRGCGRAALQRNARPGSSLPVRAAASSSPRRSAYANRARPGT